MASFDEEHVMTDAEMEDALEKLGEQADSAEVNELLKMMNENRMISWEEAEQIMCTAGPSQVVKSSLPETTRPSEPDNETDVDDCTQRLLKNDPTLKEINLNNMKRIPIPNIQKLIYAVRDNTYLRKLSMANIGLTDTGAQPLIECMTVNTSLKTLNLETNFLSGDFVVALLQSLLVNMSLEELKVVNQSMNFHTQAEKGMIEAIQQNRGLTKISVQLRLQEGRAKIEKATLRNGEIRRIIRKQEAEERAKRGGKAPGFQKAFSQENPDDPIVTGYD